MSFRSVTRTADLWPGEMRRVSLEGQGVLLLNIDGQILAFLDQCPHKRIPLSLGHLRNGVLICGSHQWQFDATSGQGLNPANAKLTAVPVHIVDGDVQIDLDGVTAGRIHES